ILNLNKGATQNEVHERYRTLSLVFHPDRQHDDQAKAIATRNFLRIQKAYQVLSDPFLREVYDQLGDDGLTFDWPEGFRSKPLEEESNVDFQLGYNVRGQLRQARQSTFLSSKGTLHCVVNATQIFQNLGEEGPVWRQISRVGFLSYSLRHDVQRRVNDKTTFGLGARVRNGVHHLDLTGTVQHQFSPRLSSLALLHFGYPFQTQIETSYQDGTNTLIVKAAGALGAPLLVTPAMSIALTRKLFRRRNEQASIDVHVGRHPQVKLRFTSPTPYGLKFTADRHNGGEGSSTSLSGLETGITFSSYGLELEREEPKLVGEFGVHLLELGATLKAGLSLGLTGINWLLSASWSKPSKSLEFSTTTTLGSSGIVVVLEFSCLEQQLHLPIVLSSQYNGPLAICTTAIPSIAGVLVYWFIVVPRRRTQRLANLRSARKHLEESEERRERDSVEQLLKDLARRHTQAEKSKQGLVILEASYGPMAEKERVQDLTLDVTIPLQALVRNSQLFIARGEESTVNGLQGFFDPAPSVPKTLCIRYLFREQMHYVEIPDIMPTVLPLLGLF
ncbi:Chaperone protein dnaJ 13, partial [Leucoagaricus sp. SymC.cos]